MEGERERRHAASAEDIAGQKPYLDTLKKRVGRGKEGLGTDQGEKVRSGVLHLLHWVEDELLSRLEPGASDHNQY